MTYRDRMDIMRNAVRNKFPPDSEANRWCWFIDMDESFAIFELDGWADTGFENGYYRIGYTRSADETVTLAESPEKVKQVTNYVTESARLVGRVLEAKGTSDTGERIYRMQVIEAGRSLNANHYPLGVLQAAAPLYDGAKVYNRHRTDAEFTTGTVEGLVGYLRDSAPTATGVEADLHVFASATAIIEALDASLRNQTAGVEPLIGMSHDVLVKFRPITFEGRTEREATEIARVLSADVVADPAAGGRAIRVVANNNDVTNPTIPKEGESMNLKQLLALLREADTAKRAELLKEHATVITDAGMTEADILAIVTPAPTPKPTTTETAPTPAPVATKVEEAEVLHASTSVMGRILIDGASSKLSENGKKLVVRMIGEKFTEARLLEAVEFAEGIDFPDPSVPIKVTVEETDKKIARLDASMEGDYRKGYRSLKAAYIDITGANPRDTLGEDFNRRILAECVRFTQGGHARESIDSTSWGQVLGDSITRRLLKMYANDNRVQQAMSIVNEVPITDFRTQRRTRMGGYGTLPTVLEGAPYQPLTSPVDEEATYAPTKRGGTEDITIETITNDDLGAVARIPRELNNAAAETLHLFVFTFLTGNGLIYDSVALFDAAGHGTNTVAGALTNATLTAGRINMMKQTKYGAGTVRLGAANTPRFLIVPPDLVETGFQLTQSAVAVPASGSVSDMPNMQTDLSLIVVASLADTNDWFLVADPNQVDGLELGFLGGPDPQIYVQADPTVGSVFDADKVTYKIRHVYGGAVVDYRPFFRGTA